MVLPLGVLEYHGEHMAVGMDTLAVVKMLELSRRRSTSSSCRPSTTARRATRSSRRRATARCRSAATSWRRLPRRCSSACSGSASATSTAIIHHQTENFAAGMPTDLAFKSAGPAGDLPLHREGERRGLVGQRGDGGLLCRARGGQQSVQLDPGAPADDAGDPCELSLRPCRRGRDLADDGALPRGSRHGAASRTTRAGTRPRPRMRRPSSATGAAT